MVKIKKKTTTTIIKIEMIKTIKLMMHYEKFYKQFELSHIFLYLPMGTYTL